jgi:hypothetical protein
MPKIENYIHRRLKIDNFKTQPYTGPCTRSDLALLFGDLGYKIGVEIGVLDGDFSKELCDSNPRLELLYCIDPWLPYREPRQKWNISKERADLAYERTKEKLKGYPVKIIRQKSMDAVKDIPDGSLNFVFIDGAHDFDNVMLDLIHWVPKVQHKGIISGHDYLRHPGFRVIEAVEAYNKNHNNYPIYKTSERHASFIMVKR